MKKLLIIEDDQVVANIYTNKFALEGYEVQAAADGESGLRMARSFKPHAVLLDLIMPGMNGITVMKELRADPEFAKTPIVVFSNTYLSNMVQQAWKAGATKCLSKASTNPRQVLESIQNLVATVEGADAPPEPEPEAILETSAPPPPPPEPEPDPVPTARDAGPEAETVRQAFISALPPTVTTIRAVLKTLMKAGNDAARVKQLEELLRRVHAITGNAVAAGFSLMAQLSEALAALLMELRDKPRNINPSTLRTLALAVDGLATLFERGLGSQSQEMPQANILVVDDEAISRRAVISALEKAKLKAVGVEDPRLAAALLTDNKFDLVFLDVDMPGMNGFELCSKLRGLPRNKTTPVVFVTGLNDFENRTQSMMSGGTDFIAKPFLFMELAVKALLHVLCAKPVSAPATSARQPAAAPIAA